MKKLAFALYVVSILLISGLTRANAAELFTKQIQYQGPVNIHQVAADMAKMQILVAGSVPYICYGDPSALMTQDAATPTTLVVHLTSKIPTDSYCAAAVKYFSTSLDIPILVQVSQVQIDPKALYTLRVEGSDFSVQVPGSDLKRMK